MRPLVVQVASGLGIQFLSFTLLGRSTVAPQCSIHAPQWTHVDPNLAIVVYLKLVELASPGEAPDVCWQRKVAQYTSGVARSQELVIHSGMYSVDLGSLVLRNTQSGYTRSLSFFGSSGKVVAAKRLWAGHIVMTPNPNANVVGRMDRAASESSMMETPILLGGPRFRLFASVDDAELDDGRKVAKMFDLSNSENFRVVAVRKIICLNPDLEGLYEQQREKMMIRARKGLLGSTAPSDLKHHADSESAEKSVPLTILYAFPSTGAELRAEVSIPRDALVVKMQGIIAQAFGVRFDSIKRMVFRGAVISCDGLTNAVDRYKLESGNTICVQLHDMPQGVSPGGGAAAEAGEELTELLAVAPEVRREDFEAKVDERVNECLCWHGSTAKGVRGIVDNGFAIPSVRNANYFGNGIYLSPVNEQKSHIMATDELYATPDARGVRQVILCTVLRGGVEKTLNGSSAFVPSSPEFDTAADALPPEEAHRIIVWQTKMNTHILPLFVVSFKVRTSIDSEDEENEEEDDVEGADGGGSAGGSKLQSDSESEEDLFS